MGIDVKSIAESFGTPLYLYDFDGVIRRLKYLRDSLHKKVEIYYAVKANSNRKILEYLGPYIDGLDVSSGGEIRQALLAGYRGSQMSFAGPGKSNAELEIALNETCGSISVENLDELRRIIRLCHDLGKKANISLRINPLMLTKSFALKMGGRATQFGLDEEEVEQATEFLRDPSLNFLGIHVYAGTQSLDAEELVKSYANTFEIAEAISARLGLPLWEINLGGGIGIPYYLNQSDIDVERVFEGINSQVRDFSSRYAETIFRMELGRYIIGEFGFYVCTVVATKNSRGKKFVVLDGGMHQNLSASGNLGQAILRNYRIENITAEKGEIEKVDITGPLCTPVDLLARDCEVAHTEVGDIIVIRNSGAYGFTASPLFFLGHETPREVLVADGKCELIRESKSLTVLN